MNTFPKAKDGRLSLVQRAKAKCWPRLAAPIYPADTEAKARACSVLRGFAMRDGEPIHACDLTAAEAHDVARWAR